jgi:DNA/RNA endonuclease YhcR with UshA esterase domain
MRELIKMKHLTLILFLLLAPTVKAQEVTLENIASFEGKTVTLCETITGTFQTKTESKVTYLNFGKSFPNNAFTIVIFKKDLDNFSYDPMTLKDKKICVTGKVGIYKGKPQIIVNKEAAIVVQ